MHNLRIGKLHHNVFITHNNAFYPAYSTAGHATVNDFQNFMRGQRRVRNESHFETKSDLLNFVKENPLPPTLKELKPWTMYAVDGLVQEWRNYPNTTGIVLTNGTSVGWLGQLLKARDGDLAWALHVDGTHKLAHGKWILETFGTHHLKWDYQIKRYVHEFCPLVYLFFKSENETIESTMMGCRALVLVAAKYFPTFTVNPAVGITDHSEMLRQGLLKSFNGIAFMNDWAHLATKWGKGKLISKSNPFYGEIWPQLEAIHFAHSTEMMYLLLGQVHDVWCEWEADHTRPQSGYTTKTLWSQYCVAPWNTWSIASYDGYGGQLPDGGTAICLDLPGILPSNQTEEAWHKVLH